MKPIFKSPPIENNQRLLFPSNIFDLLADDHESRLYHDLLQQLNTESVEEKYSVKGQHAYPPKLIVSILIYAYSRGVFSSRQIERRCNEDLSFMYIAQMNCPNFRVLSDFRKDNAEFFHSCFKQTVMLAMELGLASLGHVSLDGSKFKANSSKHKAMSYKHLKEQEEQLTQEIDALIKQAIRSDEEEDQQYKDKTGYEIPEDLVFKQTRLEKIQTARKALEDREKSLYPNQPIDEKKQISFADHDARIMGKQGGEFTYSYNPQICVDSDNQIIVAQHISQKANDKQEVKPALEKIKATTGRLPEIMSLDNGYESGDNLEALEEENIEAYVALNKGEKSSKEPLDSSNRRLVKADFTYDEEQDAFICPADQLLPLIQTKKDGRKIYQGNHEVCAECSYHTRCSQSKKGHARMVTSDKHEPKRQRMRKRMESEKAKDIYGKRKTIAEPPIGQVKNTGFRGFSVRGIEKVEGEFSLVCTVHNMKKIMRKIIGGVVCLKNGNLVKIG